MRTSMCSISILFSYLGLDPVVNVVFIHEEFQPLKYVFYLCIVWPRSYLCSGMVRGDTVTAHGPSRHYPPARTARQMKPSAK